MPSDTAIIVMVTLFCLWQFSAIVFILMWRRDAMFTARGKLLFVVVGLVLASFRLSMLAYLTYRTRTHTLDKVSRLAGWSFLPEAIILRLMPLTNPKWSPLIVNAVLFVGSFAWAWPTLLLTARQKPVPIQTPSNP
jgi:hypothetical protein